MRLRCCIGLLLLAAGAWGQARAPIGRVQLEGAEAFDQKQLMRFISSAPRLWRKTRYDERRLDKDVEALINFYRNEGFLAARVVQRQVRPIVGGDAVEVHISLEEGPRTVVRSVRLEGARQVPPDELASRLRLRAGVPFRRLQLLQDRRALQVAYAEAGLINARITTEALQDTGHFTDIVFDIAEGVPVRVDGIRLEGLDKTRPYVARRELALGSGQLLRYSRIRRSQTQLYGTGLFRLVQVEPDPADTLRPGRRDVVVTVRERPAGSLDGGIGYGTSERGRLVFAAEQRNWRGRGLQLGLNGRLSRRTRQLEGAFTEPRLWGRRLSLDGRLFWSRLRNDEARFTTSSRGGDLTLSHRLGRRWRAELRYRLERTRLLESAEAGSRLEARRTSSLMLAAARDTRSDLLDPQQGSFLQGRVEWAGGILGGRNRFVRPRATVSLYRRLGTVVGALQLQGRYIRVLGGQEPTVEYERFYLGGDGSVRGFRRDQIGAGAEGNVSLAFQSELRVPLWKLGGVAFVDGGNVWRRLRQVDPGGLRYGYGLGLRYASRVGVLRLDAGTHRGTDSLWRRSEIYIGVGQAL